MSINNNSMISGRVIERSKSQELGVTTSYNWIDDPKRLVFSLSKYKFVSKMLDGKNKVLELGGADGFASRIVASNVGQLYGVDVVSEYIDSARKTVCDKKGIVFFEHDILKGPVQEACDDAYDFDAIYSLDVLEHIESDLEDQFLSNAIETLKSDGVMIVGMPSIESQVYASPLSQEGHVNCKAQEELKELMSKYFRHVFMFSFNDEVLHTGFSKMAHYHIALCCEKKQR